MPKVHIVAGDLSSIEGSKALVAAAEDKLKSSSSSSSTSTSTAASASSSSIDLLVLNHIGGMYEDWVARVSCHLVFCVALGVKYVLCVDSCVAVLLLLCSTNTPFFLLRYVSSSSLRPLTDAQLFVLSTFRWWMGTRKATTTTTTTRVHLLRVP
jgi:hypothetical protein